MRDWRKSAGLIVSRSDPGCPKAVLLGSLLIVEAPYLATELCRFKAIAAVPSSLMSANTPRLRGLGLACSKPYEDLLSTNVPDRRWPQFIKGRRSSSEAFVGWASNQFSTWDYFPMGSQIYRPVGLTSY